MWFCRKFHTLSSTQQCRHFENRLRFDKVTECVTLTFAERNRLALSLSGNNPPSAN